MGENSISNLISAEVLGDITDFIQKSIAAGVASRGPFLRLEAHLPSDQDNRCGKSWSRLVDLRRVPSQIASPPASVEEDNCHEIEENVSPTRSTVTTRRNGWAACNARTPSEDTSQQMQAQRPSLVASNLMGEGHHQAEIHYDDGDDPLRKRRKLGASELRPAAVSVAPDIASASDTSSGSARQLENSESNVPQRKKAKDSHPKMQPSTLDKFIVGIWENLYKKNHKTQVDVSHVLSLIENSFQPPTTSTDSVSPDQYQNANQLCSRITKASSYFRGLELIVQAHWIDCFDNRIISLSQERPDESLQSHKKAALLEACQTFGWTEKELRNRMSVWRGYSELKEVAGWTSLIFSGQGIYRFCKYRIGFDANSLARLGRLHWRFEVAADTLHPDWRKMLGIIGIQSRKIYRGHPLDWVVSRTSDPVPLGLTYKQWDPNFAFKHINDCIVDITAWGDFDPRRIQKSGPYACQTCNNIQSDDSQENQCQCFAEIFGVNSKSPQPVQVFATEDGRNNGLLALCDFPRGSPIAPFLGLLTHSLHSVDVMTSTLPNPSLLPPPQLSSSVTNSSPSSSTTPPSLPTTYQILQTRQGNHTRFVNHSCVPNAQYQKFSWLGLERIILVSKGINAGQEITVDYSGRYWKGLRKKCLCGKGGCRYNK